MPLARNLPQPMRRTHSRQAVKERVMSGTGERDVTEEYVTGDVLGPERYADLGIQSGEDAGDAGFVEQAAGEEQGIDVTTTVEDHGNRRSRPEHHHAAPGDDEWREDEEGETDTPENTGSKVGPGRDDMQP
jgi:hypothetical protein